MKLYMYNASLNSHHISPWYYVIDKLDRYWIYQNKIGEQRNIWELLSHTEVTGLVPIHKGAIYNNVNKYEWMFYDPISIKQVRSISTFNEVEITVILPDL